eukprot:490299-Amphidinium_carterae.1
MREEEGGGGEAASASCTPTLSFGLVACNCERVAQALAQPELLRSSSHRTKVSGVSYLSGCTACYASL